MNSLYIDIEYVDANFILLVALYIFRMFTVEIS